MTRPIGLALLFFMAVGPVLSWHRSSPALVRSRLVLPAWAGAVTVLACALAGVRGLAPLVAFGLGAFAGTSALRQLVISTRAAAKGGAGLWRGLVGRSNGGMIVHLGVVVIGMALAASLSYGHRTTVSLAQGRPTQVLGHTFTYLGTHTVVTPARSELVANVEVAGRGVLHPGVSRFGTDPQAVGSPSISTGLRSDVYVTFDGPPQGPGGPALIGIIIQPLVSWLWIGGGIIGLGTLLAAVPRRRRRRDKDDPTRSEPGASAPGEEPPAPAPVATPVGAPVAAPVGASVAAPVPPVAVGSSSSVAGRPPAAWPTSNAFSARSQSSPAHVPGPLTPGAAAPGLPPGLDQGPGPGPSR